MYLNRTCSSTGAQRSSPAGRDSLQTKSVAVTSRAWSQVAGPSLASHSRPWASCFLKRVLYGTMPETASPHAVARERFLRQQIAFRQQEDFFSDLYERPASERYSRSWGSEISVVRFDQRPRETICSWLRPDKDDASRQLLCGGVKSSLNTLGQIVPDGSLPLSVWEEQAPVALANLAYAHVMSLNKQSFSVRLPAGATTADIEHTREEETAKLQECMGRGSPLTSFTVQPPMGKKLEEWGQAGRCIQLRGDRIRLLSPQQTAGLILAYANLPGIDEYRPYDWRKDIGCFDSPDSEAVRAMEERLSAVGIDPDGAWTRREKAVFYVLVTDEHLVMGVTPQQSAALVETRKAN